MHDFYSFLKQPNQWLFPVSADMIDENAALNSLKRVLQAQLDPANSHMQAVEELAKNNLEVRLRSMREHGDSYRSVDEFKNVLTRHIQRHTKNHSIFTQDQINSINLVDLTVTLRHIPVGERITNFNWKIVDILCIGFFMREWNFLDTAKWAERVGQWPSFQWVRDQHFDTLLMGLICTGFITKICEAAKKLFIDDLTQEEKTQTRWDVVASTAELAFYGAIFMNMIGKTAIAQSRICWMGILAKSLGVISIAMRPEHQFFQPKIAATS
jgi:hypothetical protein